MASGRIHPNEQLGKRRRGTKIVNGTANVADVASTPERKQQASVTKGTGSIGGQEQAALTVTADVIDSLPARAAVKSPRKNGAASEAETGARRLRFNASLHAKLSKRTEFSVCVFSPDKNRGQVVIESIHVGIYRKGESLFDGDVPIGKDGKISPGTKKVLSFSNGQRKQLSRALKSKTFASVSAVYTAPAETEVMFSIANKDSKKKDPNS
jgi:hypothetical protein